jgi:hypothetical protein
MMSPESGARWDDFAVDLAGNGVIRRGFDAADVGLGSAGPNGRGAQHEDGDSRSVAVLTHTTWNSPPSGRPKMPSRPYFAIRVTLPNTRLSYSSRRPLDRTICTGVIRGDGRRHRVQLSD